MKVVSWVYNALSRWARRIIHMLRTHREILLIVLVLIIGAIIALVPTAINAINPNWELWRIVLSIAVYLGLIAILFFAMRATLKGINTIDKKEEAGDILRDAKIDAIIEKLGVTKENIEDKITTKQAKTREVTDELRKLQDIDDKGSEHFDSVL